MVNVMINDLNIALYYIHYFCVVKGQVLADFLATHKLPTKSPLNDNFLDDQVMKLESTNTHQWNLYFVGVFSS